MPLGLRLADSASKHGIASEDIVHAMVHRHAEVHPYDDGRPGLGVPTLYIGLSRGGVMLAVITSPANVFVFHAMRLRPETAQRAGFYEED